MKFLSHIFVVAAIFAGQVFGQVALGAQNLAVQNISDQSVSVQEVATQEALIQEVAEQEVSCQGTGVQNVLVLGADVQESSASDVTAAIIREGTTNNLTMQHLDVLTNRIGGRLVGSSAYSDAEDWCEIQLQKWGWEVIREEVGEIPVGFNRGPWQGRMIGGNNMTLHFVTPSFTSGTKGVQRGPVVKEPLSRGEFERMKKKFAGAWVLVEGRSDWPIDYTEHGDSVRAKTIAYNDSITVINNKIFQENWKKRERRRELSRQIEDCKNIKTKAKLQKELDAIKDTPSQEYKKVPALFYREMVEAGALGFIQASKLPLTCVYDRANMMKMTFDNLPQVPDIKLDENQYEVIKKMVTDREYFELEFDIRNHFRPKPTKFHNIIAVLRGSEYPDEYVLAGGHLDAYDAGTGGVDCGSGCSVTLETARLLSVAGARPKRTIVLCLWAAEEFGLWGSKKYVDEHKDELDKISNYFNRDGGPTMCTGVTVPEAMYDDFVAVCQPLSDIYGFKVNKRTDAPRPRPKTAGGSDHAYFAMNGVPTISFQQGDPKGYNFDYMEIWHTDRDTFDKSIAEYQEQASVVTAVTVWGLANLDHILSREGLYKD